MDGRETKRHISEPAFPLQVRRLKLACSLLRPSELALLRKNCSMVFAISARLVPTASTTLVSSLLIVLSSQVGRVPCECHRLTRRHLSDHGHALPRDPKQLPWPIIHFPHAPAETGGWKRVERAERAKGYRMSELS